MCSLIEPSSHSSGVARGLFVLECNKNCFIFVFTLPVAFKDTLMIMKNTGIPKQHCHLAGVFA